MILKGFITPVLLVGMMFLSMAGCGEDSEKPIVLAEEKTEELTVEPSVSSLVKEKLLGSWEVVSIFKETPEAFFEFPEDQDGVAEAKTQAIAFHCTFADDNSWVWNLRQEIVFKDHADIPLGTVEMIGIWSGTYSVSDSTLSFILKESDTSINSNPQDFFETLVDLTEAEGKQRLAEAFRFGILAPINKSTITRHEDTLTLRVSDERKIIFEKQ